MGTAGPALAGADVRPTQCGYTLGPGESEVIPGTGITEEPVGFVMVVWDIVATPPDNDGPFLLWKLLIDHQHQGQGYGEQAVRQVINLVRAAGATGLLANYGEGEGNPFGFFTWLGIFPRSDLDPNGEIMLRRVL